MRPGWPISGKFTRPHFGCVWIFAILAVLCLPIPAQSPQQPAAAGKQERREQLLADAAMLVQLANQLKAEVDKSTKDTLSIPVVNKADEVGKLARKLREEMKP